MAPKPKLDADQMAQIRARKAADPTLTNQALADEFNVARTTVQKALASADPLPSIPGSFAELHLALLGTSPLNPRRTFSEASIAELAETIVEHGILQNLMVRRPKDDGHYAITDGAGARHLGFYEIVFGERRYRAVQLLASQGRWTGAIPCKIVDIDDATHRALATIENIQREDVLPLEEAAGLAALQAMDKIAWSTQAIAARIGKSERYVQYRIAMANNLVAPAKKLLTGKFITIEAGRLLASESSAVQLEVLSEFFEDLESETTWLLCESDDDVLATSSIEFALDHIHARQRREKEEAARAAAPPPQSEMRLNSPRTSEPSSVDSDEAEDERPYSRSASATSPKPSTQEPESGPPVNKSHIFHAHRRKSQALQDALSTDHEAALRVAILALLGPQSVALIRSRSPDCNEDRSEPVQSVEATIKRILGKVKPPEHYGDVKAELKLWEHLNKISLGDLGILFTHVIARLVHTPAGHQCLLGDSPLAEAIAETLNLPGNEANHDLALETEDLAGLRKPLLLKIADETGTPAVNDSTKIAELTEAIATKRKVQDFVLPTIRFGSTKSLEKKLQEMIK